MTSLFEKSHFSIYDFMGYIIPGCFFSTLLFVVFMGVGKRSSIVCYVLEIYEHVSRGTMNSTVLEILLLGFVSFFALVLFYLVGHVIATISHLTIDRVLVFSLLKYPFIKKLDLPGTNDYFIMALHALIWFTMIAAYLFLLAYLMFNWWFSLTISLNILLLCIIIAIIRVCVIPICSNSPDELLVSNENWPGRYSKKVYGFINRCTINPISKLLFLERKFSENFIATVKQRFEETFNVPMSDSDTNTYWLIHHYVISRSGVFEKYKNNWLRLYGLCRNTAMASSLICGLQVLLSLKYRLVISGTPNMQVCALCAVIAPLFLFRYLVLYYNYYTKNLIRAFYLLSSPNCDNVNTSGNPTVSFSIPNWTTTEGNQSVYPD